MPEIGNWTLERCDTVGTGDLNIIGTNTGASRWRDSIPSSGLVYYSIEDGVNREAGIGTFNGTDTIARTTITATLVGSVYDDTSPVAITLSGESVVTCSFNKYAFDVFQDHVNSTLNPHSVTALQAGAVDITGDTMTGELILPDATLTAIDKIASAAATVAVKIYIPSIMDDDGGAILETLSWTSWWQEVGPMPKAMLIVAEADKVTIKDATDSTLPDWMVFDAGATKWIYKDAGRPITAARMLNGILYITQGANTGQFNIFNFINDEGFYKSDSNDSKHAGRIVDRNTEFNLISIGTNYIVNRNCNAIALTSDGQGNNTLAVGTDGGVSVIHPDGHVADSDLTSAVLQVNFKDETLYYSRSGTYNSYTAKSYLSDGFGELLYNNGTIPANLLEGFIQCIDNDIQGSDKGLTHLKENPSNPEQGMVAYQTADYMSGWMHGDIKGAFLASTEAGTIGVDESTELVTGGGNPVGDFNVSGDVAYWTDGSSGSSTIAWNASEHLDLICVGGDRARADFSIPTIVDGVYTLTAVPDAATLSIDIDSAAFTDTGNLVDDSASTSLSVQFVATSTTTYIRFGHSASGATRTLDTVSVKQTGNLVLNGTFDVDASEWTAYSNATLSVDTNRLKVVSDAGYTTGVGYQAIAVESGKQYSLQVNCTLGTSATYKVWVGDTAGASNIATSDAQSASELVHLTFTPSVSTIYISLVSVDDGDHTFFDNVVLRLASADRSVNNNALEIHGELTKTAVATGSELMAYSGFSADDYLEQPYNADLDFGTGDFCIMGWVNKDALGSVEAHFAHSAIGSSDGGFMIGDATGELKFWHTLTSSYTAIASGYTLNTGQWYLVKWLRKSGILYCFVNGTEVYSTSFTDSVTYTNAILSVGYDSSYDGYVCDGSLALWRIGAGAPTPEQIEFIYNQERPLFNADTKCTLQGDGDVQALSSDQTSDVLTVCDGTHITQVNGLTVVDSWAEVATSVDTLNDMIVTGA